MDRPDGTALSSALATAARVGAQRYPDADALFLAGSHVRGEATPCSDLDLVVMFRAVPHAHRASFLFEGWPVEAFVHDPETLRYFMRRVDRPTGVPSLATMVTEGIEIPGGSAFGTMVKTMARAELDRGPDPWRQSDIDASRYAITDLLEDIRAPRSPEEFAIVLASLHVRLATHVLRRRSMWEAKGKAIPGRLAAVDEDLAEAISTCFAAARADRDADPVRALAERILQADGGLLFDGYGHSAPASWRLATDGD